jgi:nitrous oxidase accessory protein NosD
MIGAARIYGIWDEASTGAQIIDNDIGASHTAGIYLGCSDTANLQDLTCAGPSSGSAVQHNNLLDNGDYGIAIADESLDNSVESNTVAGDKTYDLEDENTGCDGGTAPPGNSWTDNIGTASQTTSANCIG